MLNLTQTSTASCACSISHDFERELLGGNPNGKQVQRIRTAVRRSHSIISLGVTHILAAGNANLVDKVARDPAHEELVKISASVALVGWTLTLLSPQSITALLLPYLPS